MLHIRFTPYDISGYTFDFLDNIPAFKRFIVAKEEHDDNNNPLLHYHILVETDYDIQTIRNAVKTNFKVPKSGRGQNNKYYAMFSDWQDPGYICKYGDIVKSKGYTEREILEFVISGKKKYLDKVKKVELSGEIAPATSSPKKEPKLSFTQLVISSAGADWYNHKRKCRDEGLECHKSDLVDMVCKAMVANGRGINEFLLKDIIYAILYEDLDYRQVVLNKLKSKIFV